MFEIARKSTFLQSLAVRVIAWFNMAIEHNVLKAHAIKKAMFLANYEHVLGDYYEFGMFEGTSFIGAFYSHLRTRLPETAPRAFWGFDSFEGFKYFDDRDVHPFFREGSYSSSYEKTLKRIKFHLGKKVEWSIVPGFLEQTIIGKSLAELGGDKVAVVFVDLDLGTPAKIALDFVAPGLQQGSIIILDDFFAYHGDKDRGVAGAFKEFQKENPRFVFRRCFDYGYFGQAFIVARIEDGNAKTRDGK